MNASSPDSIHQNATVAPATNSAPKNTAPAAGASTASTAVPAHQSTGAASSAIT
ncbi:hypothetical protein [Actinophytocola sp.]|uniref:hypothetical protein n=1 Tax=Actinophytocola sp. TaxID=1872138 RepID=UPI003D6AD417